MKALRDELMAILSGCDKCIPSNVPVQRGTRLTREVSWGVTASRCTLRGSLAAAKPNDIMRTLF